MHFRPCAFQPLEDLCIGPERTRRDYGIRFKSLTVSILANNVQTLVYDPLAPGSVIMFVPLELSRQRRWGSMSVSTSPSPISSLVSTMVTFLPRFTRNSAVRHPWMSPPTMTTRFPMGTVRRPLAQSIPVHAMQTW
jgi:hypothetical protein